VETIRVRNPRNGEFDYEFEVPEHEVLVEGAAALRAALSTGTGRPTCSRRASSTAPWSPSTAGARRRRRCLISY
jgi:hypothetical protein